MPGKICEIISGGRTGKVAFVDNKQEKVFTDKGKVHAYCFNSDNTPVVSDGRHQNGLIAVERLKVTGFYD